MSAATYRRVVTGLDAKGRSCVILDGPPVPMNEGFGMLWRSDSVPADNSGNADIQPAPFSFDLMHGDGSLFMVIEYPPGMQSIWHATDTIDYIVVLRGEVVLAVETGEVKLKAGDFFIDRGVNHAWRNETDETAAIAIVNLPAHPVGKGRTV